MQILELKEETGGFEPPMPYKGTTVFKTATHANVSVSILNLILCLLVAYPARPLFVSNFFIKRKFLLSLFVALQSPLTGLGGMSHYPH